MSGEKGLSAIADEVLSDVQKEAEAAILSAEREAKNTLKLAKEEAKRNYHDIIKQAAEKAEAEKRKIASVTEIEMRNRLFQTKDELVEYAFEKAFRKIQDYTKTEKYHTHLLELIQEGIKKIGQKDLVLQINASDSAWLNQAYLNRLCKKLDCSLKLSDQTLTCIGGCKIQTVDGKISYDGTLDNKFEELKPLLRVEVAKLLFRAET